MQRLILALVALLVWAGASPARAQACGPAPGAETLWAKRQVRFVIFGEYHGTAETPAFFADVVCQALRTGRPVHVGLELAEAEQAGLDRFLAGQAAAYAPARVFDDGRHSEAMSALVGRLRQFRRSRARLEVFAFDRETERDPRSQTPQEQAMASAWRDRAVAHPDALLLILAGNLHAMKQRPAGMPFTPAAAFLPPESVIALRTTQPGGAIWACTRDGCGPTPWPARGEALPRGVHLGGGDASYDGLFSVGRPFTPSPPAAQPAR